MKFFTVLFFLLSIIYLIVAAPGEPGAPIDYDEYGDSSEEVGGTPLHEIPGIRL
uniref:Tsetse thrombin inhibitor n=1 Tax=Glossina morsitans morsitans TaxID=37546 RepID=TTI_GLOMM|nr:RecName: Full=Tsetse thrombin inhibitor; Flags: Precursor [Glossina morsitans morsitans]AAC79986.1 tsetse thrombin inhibitor precursor [Glossina morsitans morsitans]